MSNTNDGFKTITINPLKGNVLLKVYVTGIVISEHIFKFPNFSNLILNIEGTNVPEYDGDDGTPDYYLFEDVLLLENKAMKFNCDIYNILDDEVKFSLYVSCIQDDSEQIIYKLEDSKIKKQQFVSVYFWSKFVIGV